MEKRELFYPHSFPDTVSPLRKRKEKRRTRKKKKKTNLHTAMESLRRSFVTCVLLLGSVLI